MATNAALWSPLGLSQNQTSSQAIDDAFRVLREKKEEFARLPIPQKIALLKDTLELTVKEAPHWVASGTAAKGLPPDHGEEWLKGPLPTVRNIRLLIDSLERIQFGKPMAAKMRRDLDGRVTVRVFPGNAMDTVLFAPFSIEQLMMPEYDEAKVTREAATFYKQPHPSGGISLVLGAGNVSSIPPTDVLYKHFAEGRVCILKINPVNEWVGPHLERAFKPFITSGYLRIVYGGKDVGEYLVNHPAIDDVHITGSNLTHDLIVWGPPGSERERRKRENDPAFKKPISSELGNISPVVIVPDRYSERELSAMAQNIGSMVANNASFNCNAAKLLVTAQEWAQRDEFIERLASYLASIPTRKAYYPGAQERYRTLTQNRTLRTLGVATPEKLPWTLILDVDSNNPEDPIFSTEPFCSILSETRLASRGPAEFLNQATKFLNEQVWGTLNATLLISPRLERSREVSNELLKATRELKYGTVAINQWPGLVFGAMSPAWGGHPSASLQNIQSGMGWVHNTNFLEGIEKTILRGPLVALPKPVWFSDHARVPGVGKKMLELELSPSWLKIPGIAIDAFRG